MKSSFLSKKLTLNVEQKTLSSIFSQIFIKRLVINFLQNVGRDKPGCNPIKSNFVLKRRICFNIGFYLEKGQCHKSIILSEVTNLRQMKFFKTKFLI